MDLYVVRVDINFYTVDIGQNILHFEFMEIIADASAIMAVVAYEYN